MKERLRSSVKRYYELGQFMYDEATNVLTAEAAELGGVPTFMEIHSPSTGRSVEFVLVEESLNVEREVVSWRYVPKSDVPTKPNDVRTNVVVYND